MFVFVVGLLLGCLLMSGARVAIVWNSYDVVCSICLLTSVVIVVFSLKISANAVYLLWAWLH